MPFDRTRIDVALARRLVTAQFPEWAGLEIRPVELDGWDNRTFRLGEELSVRLPTGDWYAEQVAKEQRWLPVLAPALPLPIPVPLAQGRPGEGFPYPWSVYRWLEGAPAAVEPADRTALAVDLAAFLRALARCDAAGGPAPGRHNFFRGAPLAHYEAEALDAIEALGEAIPRPAVLRTWQRATASRWEHEPVWFHGDVAAGNLLVRDGRLAAVIDFGSSGVGDPACDVVIAWTYLDRAGRAAFREALEVDDGTWARGRGWALWKSLITMRDADREAAAARRREIAAVATDDVRIEPADPRSPAAQSLLRRYFAEMISTYQGRPATEAEIDLTEEEYPTGDLDVLLLAADEGEAVGCAGLRLAGDGAEVMRVFVVPDARRLGLGERLMAALETHARARGVRELRLDTRSDLVEAGRLYSRLGYEPIARFNDAPYADRWYRKRLA